MDVLEPNPAPSRGIRPRFLTVICILTFLGSGWGITKAFRSYMVADSISNIANEAMSDAQDKMDSNTPGVVKNLFNSISENMSPVNIRKSSVCQFFSCVLTLLGAILMWNLNKTGFYLYVAGIVVGIVAPMLMLGQGILGAVSSGVVGFFGVIFIVMYAVNLKYMKK